MIQVWLVEAVDALTRALRVDSTHRLPNLAIQNEGKFRGKLMLN